MCVSFVCVCAGVRGHVRNTKTDMRATGAGSGSCSGRGLEPLLALEFSASFQTFANFHPF